MADTLVTVVQRVSRKVGLDPSVTSFSENDETRDVVQDVNDAYFDLLRALPDFAAYLVDTSGSITTADGTRTYSLTTGSISYNVLEWSFENETENDTPLSFVTLEYIQEKDSKFDETEGKPQYVYLEGSNTLGVYPVPDGVYNIKYRFAKTFSRLSATTDSFAVPDEWVRYIERKAQYYYELRKGLGDAASSFGHSEEILADIIAEIHSHSPTYFLPPRFF